MTISPRSDFIGELCVALAHRWEPERLFMIFTAYFDEAASHGKDPRLTMAALLGNAYEWRRAETRLARLQKKYGFTIFHAKDFKAHKGEFRGWKEEDYQGLVFSLTELIRDTLAEGACIVLPRDVYMNEYRSGYIPKGMTLDSQYGVCFRACLSELVDFILSRGGKNHVLHVVIEDGHSNVGDCSRIFNDVKVDSESRGHRLLGTITIAKKEEAPPLMVADFLAHTHFLMDSRIQAGGTSYEQLTEGIPNKSKDAPLTFMKLNAGALTSQKQRWEAEKQRKIEVWRAAKDARRLSLQGQSS